ARARQAGLEFAPALLFQHPTIAEIAAHAFCGASFAVEPPIPATGPVPLSPPQREFFERNRADPDHAIEVLWLDIDSGHGWEWIPRAVREIVARHDALRLRFARTNSDERQATVAEDGPEPFARFDLSLLSAADQGPAVDALAAGIMRS